MTLMKKTFENITVNSSFIYPLRHKFFQSLSILLPENHISICPKSVHKVDTHSLELGKGENNGYQNCLLFQNLFYQKINCESHLTHSLIHQFEIQRRCRGQLKCGYYRILRYRLHRKHCG